MLYTKHLYCVVSIMERSESAATYHLFMQLEDALAVEHVYQPRLQLPVVAENKTDITTGMRDGSAHVLRCLKVWFDLPTEALRKHLACISVSALHLAAETLAPGQSPALSQLATISQCGCTAHDLERMAGLIEQKLGPGIPTTPAHYLTLFIKLLEQKKMEIVACDASCSNFRPCELALVLLCMHIQEPSLNLTQDQLRTVAELAMHLQRLCQIGEGNFWCCHQVVLHTFELYNGQSQIPYKQRLVWRLSQRTMRYLRPTSKLSYALPTIQENCMLQFGADRKRSQSLSSEDSSVTEREDSDWLEESDAAEKWVMLPLHEEELSK
ncbi:hypothetical protein B566_EDAN018185 [Ephemera danica]|nr:hypothetical protein B566_EDAN018185 [Ephemera danica]